MRGPKTYTDLLSCNGTLSCPLLLNDTVLSCIGDFDVPIELVKKTSKTGSMQVETGSKDEENAASR
jgi:hypothetical protein